MAGSETVGSAAAGESVGEHTGTDRRERTMSGQCAANGQRWAAAFRGLLGGAEASELLEGPSGGQRRPPAARTPGATAPPGPARAGGIPGYLYLLRAKDLIDRSYAEPLDVAAIAREALASPAHFSRNFKRAFGEPPHQYLLRRRIERAKELLRATDLPITDVCLAVGLHGLGSFSTAFRRHVGESPSEYRARWRSQVDLGLRSVPACFSLMWTRPSAAVDGDGAVTTPPAGRAGWRVTRPSAG